jgi:hypothetical protein
MHKQACVHVVERRMCTPVATTRLRIAGRTPAKLQACTLSETWKYQASNIA